MYMYVQVLEVSALKPQWQWIKQFWTLHVKADRGLSDFEWRLHKKEMKLSLTCITNVDHRIRNQHISLDRLGTTPSPGVDEYHSRGAFCACISISNFLNNVQTIFTKHTRALICLSANDVTKARLSVCAGPRALQSHPKINLNYYDSLSRYSPGS